MPRFGFQILFSKMHSFAFYDLFLFCVMSQTQFFLNACHFGVCAPNWMKSSTFLTYEEDLSQFDTVPVLARQSKFFWFSWFLITQKCKCTHIENTTKYVFWKVTEEKEFLSRKYLGIHLLIPPTLKTCYFSSNLVHNY